jgi:transcriptional regulator of acetoin/glycerol metabolism
MSNVLVESSGLRETRDTLVQQGPIRFNERAHPVSELILRSWRRCVSAETPIAQLQPRLIQQPSPSNLLVQASGPALDQLQVDLADVGIAVLLSNRSGRLVARRAADRSQRDRLDSYGGLEGFDCSERILGTNGLGTALEERQAIWVRGAEHFNDELQGFCCVGVPIMGPRGGVLAGSISLAATSEASNPLMLSLARFAAHEIEVALDQLLFAREAALVKVLARRSRRGSGPRMLLTEDSVSSDASLLPLLTPSSHLSLWEQVHNHPWTGASDTFEIDLAGIPTSVAARRVDDAEGNAYLLEFADIAGRSNRGATLAALPGSLSPTVPVHPDPAVRDELCRVAPRVELLNLSGRPGSGRLHTSSQLALKTGRSIVVLEAGMIGRGLSGSEWSTSAAAALTDGQCVVVRHFERLRTEDAPVIEQLAELVRSQRRSGRGNQGLLITNIDSGRASAASSDVAQFLGFTVSLPDLADMSNLIPDIVTSIIRTIGHPARQASASALQALARWSWPGNVGELRCVLIGASSLAQGAIIQVDDLPAHIVDAHRSSTYTGLQRAERRAIVESLKRWDWNRTKAAEELGIGRTTLYRKLREMHIDSPADPMQ